ncbi:hypothetical protein ACO0LD_16125 [Undibacterium sp. Ji83W]|uniref:hypothetical protein n=1 Tax=Undibacterium sp. Ji83W TaxID=3413043 RepID=UPI003BF28B07
MTAAQINWDIEIELSGFMQDVVKLNSLVMKFNKAFDIEKFDDDFSANTLELTALSNILGGNYRRALQISDKSHPVFQHLEKAIKRLSFLAEVSDELSKDATFKLEWIKQKSEALRIEGAQNLEIPFLYATTTEIGSRHGIASFLNLLGPQLMRIKNERKWHLIDRVVTQLARFSYEQELQNAMADNIPPTLPPVDNGTNQSEDEDMEKRIDQLENDMSIVKADVAVIRSNYGTKLDISELKLDLKSDINNFATQLKADISEAKNEIKAVETSVTRWFIATVVGLLFGFGGILVAITNIVKPSIPVQQTNIETSSQNNLTKILPKKQ